jgi:hypothetical protein
MRSVHAMRFLHTLRVSHTELCQCGIVSQAALRSGHSVSRETVGMRLLHGSVLHDSHTPPYLRPNHNNTCDIFATGGIA